MCSEIVKEIAEHLLISALHEGPCHVHLLVVEIRVSRRHVDDL